MKRRVARIFILFFIFTLFLVGCQKNNNSTFSIHFIDVGQGDAALVECDGHFMLIDAGDTNAGEKVRRVLEEHHVQKLDILALSHLHADHIGGLENCLTNLKKIRLTISNATEGSTETFHKVEHELHLNITQIKIPSIGMKYELGSAIVEVIDVANELPNDSLVLLITYKNTRFLFTGDIQKEAQRRIAAKYHNENDTPFKINLMKMPHHGASEDDYSLDSSATIDFIRTFMPDYAVISCGKNIYGHPSDKTLKLLEDAGTVVYRTDRDEDIIITSNGTDLSIRTSRERTQ